MNHANTPERPGISHATLQAAGIRFSDFPEPAMRERLPVKPIWSPPPKRKAPGLATAGDEKLDSLNLPQGTAPVNACPLEKGAQ